MVFESRSMRYENLVARFWLRVRRVPQSSCHRQSRDKRQELWGREWFGAKVNLIFEFGLPSIMQTDQSEISVNIRGKWNDIFR